MESKSQTEDFTKEAGEVIASFKSVSISNVNDLIGFVAPLMRVAKKYAGLSGAEKKNIVIGALKKFVDMTNLDDTAKAPILFAIDAVIPAVIDEIFSLKPEDFKKFLCCC